MDFSWYEVSMFVYPYYIIIFIFVPKLSMAAFTVVIISWMLTWTVFKGPGLVIAVITPTWCERSITPCTAAVFPQRCFHFAWLDLSSGAQTYCLFYTSVTLLLHLSVQKLNQSIRCISDRVMNVWWIAALNRKTYMKSWGSVWVSSTLMFFLKMP